MTSLLEHFVAADIPVTKEPTGLSIKDNKQPDGLTLLPWRGGRGCDCDMSVGAVVCHKILDSLRRGRTGGASRKSDKYANLPNSYLFQPIALDNLGAINESVTSLVSELGHTISVKSNDPRESIFLFQRLSVTLQCFNSIIVRESSAVEDPNK